MRKILGIIAGVALSVPGIASAQAASIGEREFQNSCSQCHGPKGKGDGHLVEYLIELGSLDLTGLQKANGGVFPVSRVYNVIEGTTASVHGGNIMPIWGDRYRQRSAAEMAEMDSTMTLDQERALVRNRILALVEYISSIQEE